MWTLHQECMNTPNLRARVIAPTLGDGIAAAVDGPNGLLTLSKGQAKWLPSAPGGACVKYPNGSRVWILGTPTEKDVDRLRALTNCIAEGSLIQTDRGPVSIEEVQPGDKALTRAGYRRVIALWDRWEQEVYEVTTEGGRVVVGTADHPVWTKNRGRVPLHLLEDGDILVACESTSNTEASGTTDLRVTSTFKRTMERCSTGESVKMFTAPSPTDTTSTTLTTTMRTTTPRTSWLSRVKNTVVSTWRSGKTISNGCGTRGVGLGPSTKGGLKSALTAARSSTTGGGLISDDAPRVARSGGPSDTSPGTFTSSTQRASSAGMNSVRSGTTWVDYSVLTTSRPAPGPAPHGLRGDVVKTVSRLSKTSRVYDLSIEEHHEFFADGVLVFNCDFDVFEEFFANPKASEAFKQADLSRRRGSRRFLISSTPRPHPIIKEWEANPRVHIRRGTSRDNKYIPLDWLATLEKTYKGTRLYRQEVLGEVIEDVEGALWKANDVERSRVAGPASAVASICERIVVGVDPPTGQGTCGIVVVGQDANGHMYVLDDRSVEEASPHEWAARVYDAANTYDAVVVAEINQGGQMVKEVLNSAGHDLPLHTVNATKSKKTRAEPIALLWEVEEQVVHMVTQSTKLIDEMCEWVPGEGASPDRVDALVWACWFLRSRHTAVIRSATVVSEGPVGLPSALSSVRMGRY